MQLLRASVLSFCLVLWFYSFAEENLDTVSHSLNEVVVAAKKAEREVIHAQTLSGEELERLNSNSIADALRYFSGVQIKDYGGIGGIKTVNVRSMGTNHTGVVYDGVALGNAQNGQIDLGQFSLDNIEAVSLYNGQKSEILQSARDFGAAANVYIKTKTPSFIDGERVHFKVNFRTGSFDLINPSALVEVRFSHSVNVSANYEWLKSSGRYKFRYRRVNPEGEAVYDTTAVRRNGDVNASRFELNLNGTLANATWNAKYYIYTSRRGIPGAIVNNVWRRGERLWDLNTFIQGNFTGFYGKFSTLNNLKFASYRTHYVNDDEWQLKVDNIYRQKEFYLSSANRYELAYWCDISGAYDFAFNTMDADIYGFPLPERFSHYIAIASAFDFQRVKAQVSIQTTIIEDRLRKTGEKSHRNSFNPSVYLSAFPLRNSDFSLRAFFKQSFRMPTFNDLYYTEVGNASLKPEKATQYNLGATYSHRKKGLVSDVSLSIDAYYNRIDNKIVAYPKGTQFRWTMLNLGKVDITGIDITGLVTIHPFNDLYLTLRGQYTFQRAIDVTDPSDSYYRDQIPYIPRHSGSIVGNLVWKSWGLNYSWIYVGERYNQQENIIYNYMQPWYTSDLSISKDFQWGRFGFRTLLEINNLLSQDYDVILNYPMPKRNFRLTLSLSY